MFYVDDVLEFRDHTELNDFKFNDENISTDTSQKQLNKEATIEKYFDRYQKLQYRNARLSQLFRSEHRQYLEIMQRNLPQNLEMEDCGRPFFLYQILHAAQLLNFQFDDDTLHDCVQFLIQCRVSTGGFGGYPGAPHAHLVHTCSAVHCLCIIGTPNAYRAIERESLEKFLFAMRHNDGSFRIHFDGECDVRGVYCAISCAKLTNMPPDTLERLFAGTGDWIASCQTYEGGFGATPDLEAHGGNTFCGTAGLALLNEAHKCNRQALLKWSLQRQMRFEGGFQGRTNKLVDSCYAFWVGASISITQATLRAEDRNMCQSLFDVTAVQEFIILCCQSLKGGVIDSPGKLRDIHHTCYGLSGLAIAQHSELFLCPQVLGDAMNELVPIDPCFVLASSVVTATMNFFSNNR